MLSLVGGLEQLYLCKLCKLQPLPTACVQVEALTNTLAQMQATNNAFSASLRQDDVTPEQQRALRCGVMGRFQGCS
jgi:hypothetical protein